MMTTQHEFHIKLSFKKTSSGKCQVRFQAKLRSEKDFYGYFLTSPDEKLKDVVTLLNNRLSFLNSQDPFHFHLYSIGRDQKKLTDFIIFQSKAS